MAQKAKDLAAQKQHFHEAYRDMILALTAKMVRNE